MWSSVRRAADAVLAGAWGRGLALAARSNPAVPRWAPAGGGVMMVAPHPDDEVAGAGGVALLHREAGDPVTVLQVTDGRGSRAQGLAPDAMAARRHAEAAGAMRVLGASGWEWLGFREWEWQVPDLVGVLRERLAALAPRVLYAPSRVDFHPEHFRVAQALAAALASLAGPAPAVRFYQVQVPLTRVLVNLVAPVGAVRERLQRAAAEYGTQEGALRSSLRLKYYAACVHGLPGGAEEFWEMPAGAYVALHAPEPAAPLHRTFRGLRRLALSDPLAYSAGRAERRRLRGRVASLRTDR